MLLNDLLDAARGKGGSLLLKAVEGNIAHLYATESVREEVERRLDGRARQGRVAPPKAFAVWRDRYLPAIRFVSVEGIPRGRAVETLAERHRNDLPTGLLAELLAPCLVFSGDNDLIDCGIARRDWMNVTHNAEEAEQLRMLFSGGAALLMIVGALSVEGVNALHQLARAAPIQTMIGGVLVTVLVYAHLTSDRGREQISGAKTLAKDAGARLGEVIDVATRAQVLVRSAAFVLEVEPTELAHAARVVAVAPEPTRESELAAGMNITTQKASYMLRHPIFTRREHGHYLLGRDYASIERKPCVEE